MLRVSSSQMMMQEAITVTHGFILVPAKGVCEGTVLSCTRSACSRGYKRGERGREAPKSLLEEGLIVVNSDVGARSKCVCSECGVMPREPTDPP